MSDNAFKYHELVLLLSTLEVQVTTLETVLERSEDEDRVAFLKDELKKYKSLRAKTKRITKEY